MEEPTLVGEHQNRGANTDGKAGGCEDHKGGCHWQNKEVEWRRGKGEE